MGTEYTMHGGAGAMDGVGVKQRQWIGSKLAEIDGHTVLHPKFFEELEDEELGIHYDPWHMVIHFGDNSWVALFDLFEDGQYWTKELAKDGGFWSAGPAELGIWVLALSHRLCRHFAVNPRDSYGRGTQHRINCAALQAEEE